MTRVFLSLACLLCINSLHADDEVIDVPYKDVGKKFRLLGKLHVPFGKIATIQGEVLPDRAKSIGLRFLVMRIDGLATQEEIVLKLADRSKVEVGKYYELTGYESGGYSGVAQDAIYMGVIPPQSMGFAYLSEFTIVTQNEIPRVALTPADFLGREALFSGIAQNNNDGGELRGDGWTVVNVFWSDPFPDDVVGKLIETRGRYAPLDPAHHRFNLIKQYDQWRLVRLEDQVGKQVELRGIVDRRNEHYWFNYRGAALYVEGLDDPKSQRALQSRTITVRGTLLRKSLPRLYDSGPGREHRDEYIVVDATWKPIDDLLSPERANHY
jgi:hypothetical protein